ncbi:MAG: sugar-binding protein [Kiritimatiellia bacterium]
MAVFGLFTFFGLGIGVALAEPVEQPAPELRIPVVDQAPTLDGDLSDAAWRQAAEIKTFNLLGKVSGTIDQRAMLMADGTWLFIAYEIAHPMPREIKPEILSNPNRELKVVRDDSVEVFFDPGTDGKLYFQFGLNAANVSGARRNIIGAVEQTSGLIPWRHATKITDNGWNAEMAIPLTLLASGGDLAQARMNLCISRKLPLQTVPGVTSGHEREHSSWARLAGSFHAPESFVRVNGLGEVKINVPFFPVLLNAGIKEYRIAENACLFDVELANAFGEAGTAMASIRATQPDGSAVETSETVALAGGEKRTLTISAPAPATRQVTVDVRDAGTDALLQSMVLTPDQLSGLNLLQAYFNRSYYTAEAEAVAVCQVNASAADLATLRVRLRDGAGREITNAPAGADARLSVPLTHLDNGRHDFTVELYRVADAGTLATQALQLVKQAPRPGREWKIDRVNRILLRNDEPFFPFGICARIDLDDTVGWRELGEAFNCIVSWNRRMDDADMARRYAAMAAEHGLAFISRASEFFEPEPRNVAQELKKLGYDALTQWHLDRVMNVHSPRVVAGIEALLDAENVMGCFIWDEPSYSQYDQSAPGRALNELFKRIDTYRPTIVNYAAYIPEGDKYTDWFDILMTDPYWVPTGPVHIGTPNWVSRRTFEINQLAAPARFRQPIMIIPDAEYWSGTIKRALFPDEQRVQTYLALIHGAKGIIYWFYPVIHQGSFDTFVALGAEMQKLGPAIIAPDVPQQITYTPQPFDPASSTYPDVQVALRRQPDGKYILLAANSRPYPVEASYKLAGLPDGAVVGDLFGAGQFTVADGAFTEKLARYATRAYVLDGPAQWNSGAPVAIGVTAEGDTSAYTPEPPSHPVTGRPGKKNLLPNSSFEECALPGWPDYTRIMAWKQIMTINRVGGTAPFFQAVSDNPFHGKKCLLITRDPSPVDRARFGNREGVSIKVNPRETAPREYVFSAWMRANRAGAKATLYFTGWHSGSFELTTEWQRYSIKGIIKPDSSGTHCYVIAGIFGHEPEESIQPGDAVWFDALQFERGGTPTEYEP